MSLHSMTGFARKRGEHAKYNWTWEVRSVNAKGLDVRLRFPSGYDVLDMMVRKQVSNTFKRGSISLTLNLNCEADQTSYRVNQDLLDQLVGAMATLKDKVPGAAAPSLDGLMALRGVIETVEDDDGEDERDALIKAIMKSLDTLLADLKTNRSQEGDRMADVLAGHVDEIERLCGLAENCAAAQPTAIRDRLVRQLKDVMQDLPDLDEERISQEAAVLMTKADVREELDRLRAHIDGARSLMQKGSPCGRKLDFLCQEFNREANTLCSKAQDVELTRIGLDFKTVIDQFREQVQNIE